MNRPLHSSYYIIWLLSCGSLLDEQHPSFRVLIEPCGIVSTVMSRGLMLNIRGTNQQCKRRRENLSRSSVGVPCCVYQCFRVTFFPQQCLASSLSLVHGGAAAAIVIMAGFGVSSIGTPQTAQPEILASVDFIMLQP